MVPTHLDLACHFGTLGLIPHDRSECPCPFGFGTDWRLGIDAFGGLVGHLDGLRSYVWGGPSAEGHVAIFNLGR